MQADPCRVSVVIPLYNSTPTLRRAVASALAQTLTDIEVLIVDDGSQDASLSLAHRLAGEDPRVRVIALPENRGKPHAMNAGDRRGAWRVDGRAGRRRRRGSFLTIFGSFLILGGSSFAAVKRGHQALDFIH